MSFLKTYQKSVASLVTVCFITSFFTLPPPALAQPVAEKIPLSFVPLGIPPELASIEEVFIPDPKKEAGVPLIHIQSVHAHAQTQKKIYGLLKLLDEKYGINALYIEGAGEKLNPDYFRFFNDNKLNIRVAEKLVEKGELTGAELFLIESQKKIPAYGLEDPSLYRENLTSFEKVMTKRTLTSQFTRETHAFLDRLETLLLAPDAQKLLRASESFDAGQMELLSYALELERKAKELLELDLRYYENQLDWPQMIRLLRLQELETKLEPEKIQSDRQKLIDFLRQIQVDPSFVKSFETLSFSPFQAGMVYDPGFRKNDLPRYLAERLVEATLERGFSFEQYPYFTRYLEAAILQSELEAERLFGEMERLFEALIQKVSSRQEEWKLVGLVHEERLLERLFDLELTPKDYAKVEARSQADRPLVRFLLEIESLYESTPHPSLSPSRGGGWGEGKKFIPDNIQALESVYGDAIQFYSLAKEREDVMIEKILTATSPISSSLTSPSPPEGERVGVRGVSVLITGGFHTDGLSRQFRKKGIPYTIVSPRITEKVSPEVYISNLLGETKTAFDTQYLEVAANSEHSDLLLGMFPKHRRVKMEWNRTTKIVPAAIEVGYETRMPVGQLLYEIGDSPFFRDRRLKVRSGARYVEISSAKNGRSMRFSIGKLVTETDVLLPSIILEKTRPRSKPHAEVRSEEEKIIGGSVSSAPQTSRRPTGRLRWSTQLGLSPVPSVPFRELLSWGEKPTTPAESISRPKAPGQVATTRERRGRIQRRGVRPEGLWSSPSTSVQPPVAERVQAWLPPIMETTLSGISGIVNTFFDENKYRIFPSRAEVRSVQEKKLAQEIDQQIIKPLLNDTQLDPGMKPYIEELKVLPKQFNLKGLQTVETDLGEGGKPTVLHLNPDLFQAFLKAMPRDANLRNFVRAIMVKEAGVIRFPRENPLVSPVFYTSHQRILEYLRTLTAGVQVPMPAIDSPLYGLIRHHVAAWLHLEFGSLQYQIAYMRAKGLIKQKHIEALAQQRQPILQNYFSRRKGYEKFLLAPEKEQKLVFLSGYYTVFDSLPYLRRFVLHVLKWHESQLDQQNKGLGLPLAQFSSSQISQQLGSLTVNFSNFLVEPRYYSTPIENLPVLSRAEVRAKIQPILEPLESRDMLSQSGLLNPPVLLNPTVFETARARLVSAFPKGEIELPPVTSSQWTQAARPFVTDESERSFLGRGTSYPQTARQLSTSIVINGRELTVDLTVESASRRILDTAIWLDQNRETGIGVFNRLENQFSRDNDQIRAVFLGMPEHITPYSAGNHDQQILMDRLLREMTVGDAWGEPDKTEFFLATYGHKHTAGELIDVVAIGGIPHAVLHFAADALEDAVRNLKPERFATLVDFDKVRPIRVVISDVLNKEIPELDKFIFPPFEFLGVAFTKEAKEFFRFFFVRWTGGQDLTKNFNRFSVALDEYARTNVHEFGHIVSFVTHPDDILRRIRDSYPEKHFPASYSTSHPEEGFAEFFSSWLDARVTGDDFHLPGNRMEFITGDPVTAALFGQSIFVTEGGKPVPSLDPSLAKAPYLQILVEAALREAFPKRRVAVTLLQGKDRPDDYGVTSATLKIIVEGFGETEISAVSQRFNRGGDAGYELIFSRLNGTTAIGRGYRLLSQEDFSWYHEMVVGQGTYVNLSPMADRDQLKLLGESLIYGEIQSKELIPRAPPRASNDPSFSPSVSKKPQLPVSEPQIILDPTPVVVSKSSTSALASSFFLNAVVKLEDIRFIPLIFQPSSAATAPNPSERRVDPIDPSSALEASPSGFRSTGEGIENQAQWIEFLESRFPNLRNRISVENGRILIQTPRGPVRIEIQRIERTREGHIRIRILAGDKGFDVTIDRTGRILQIHEQGVSQEILQFLDSLGVPMPQEPEKTEEIERGFLALLAVMGLMAREPFRPEQIDRKARDAYFTSLALRAEVRMDPEEMVRILRDPEARPQGRKAAERDRVLESLAGMGEEAKELTPRLVEMLTDKEFWARWNAVEALGKIGSYAKEAVPALVQGLHDDNSHFRRHVMRTLAEIGPQAHAAVSALIPFLKDEDGYDRTLAAEALKNIGPAAHEAVPHLMTALKDRDFFDEQLLRTKILSADRDIAQIQEKNDKLKEVLRQALEKITQQEVSLEEKSVIPENIAASLRENLKSAVDHIRQALQLVPDPYRIGFSTFNNLSSQLSAIESGLHEEMKREELESIRIQMEDIYVKSVHEMDWGGMPGRLKGEDFSKDLFRSFLNTAHKKLLLAIRDINAVIGGDVRTSITTRTSLEEAKTFISDAIGILLRAGTPYFIPLAHEEERVRVKIHEAVFGDTKKLGPELEDRRVAHWAMLQILIHRLRQVSPRFEKSLDDPARQEIYKDLDDAVKALTQMAVTTALDKDLISHYDDYQQLLSEAAKKIAQTLVFVRAEVRAVTKEDRAFVEALKKLDAKTPEGYRILHTLRILLEEPPVSQAPEIEAKKPRLQLSSRELQEEILSPHHVLENPKEKLLTVLVNTNNDLKLKEYLVDVFQNPTSGRIRNTWLIPLIREVALEGEKPYLILDEKNRTLSLPDDASEEAVEKKLREAFERYFSGERPPWIAMANKGEHSYAATLAEGFREWAEVGYSNVLRKLIQEYRSKGHFPALLGEHFSESDIDMIERQADRRAEVWDPERHLRDEAFRRALLRSLRVLLDARETKILGERYPSLTGPRLKTMKRIAEEAGVSRNQTYILEKSALSKAQYFYEHLYGRPVTGDPQQDTVWKIGYLSPTVQEIIRTLPIKTVADLETQIWTIGSPLREKLSKTQLRQILSASTRYEAFREASYDIQQPISPRAEVRMEKGRMTKLVSGEKSYGSAGVRKKDVKSFKEIPASQKIETHSQIGREADRRLEDDMSNLGREPMQVNGNQIPVPHDRESLSSVRVVQPDSLGIDRREKRVSGTRINIGLGLEAFFLAKKGELNDRVRRIFVNFIRKRDRLAHFIAFLWERIALKSSGFGTGIPVAGPYFLVISSSILETSSFARTGNTFPPATRTYGYLPPNLSTMDWKWFLIQASLSNFFFVMVISFLKYSTPPPHPPTVFSEGFRHQARRAEVRGQTRQTSLRMGVTRGGPIEEPHQYREGYPHDPQSQKDYRSSTHLLGTSPFPPRPVLLGGNVRNPAVASRPPTPKPSSPIKTLIRSESRLLNATPVNTYLERSSSHLPPSSLLGSSFIPNNTLAVPETDVNGRLRRAEVRQLPISDWELGIERAGVGKDTSVASTKDLLPGKVLLPKLRVETRFQGPGATFESGPIPVPALAVPLAPQGPIAPLALLGQLPQALKGRNLRSELRVVIDVSSNVLDAEDVYGNRPVAEYLLQLLTAEAARALPFTDRIARALSFAPQTATGALVQKMQKVMQPAGRLHLFEEVPERGEFFATVWPALVTGQVSFEIILTPGSVASETNRTKLAQLRAEVRRLVPWKVDILTPQTDQELARILSETSQRLARKFSVTGTGSMLNLKERIGISVSESLWEKLGAKNLIEEGIQRFLLADLDDEAAQGAGSLVITASLLRVFPVHKKEKMKVGRDTYRVKKSHLDDYLTSVGNALANLRAELRAISASA